MVKIVPWYDNEWGSACRLADITAFVASKLRTRQPAAATA
jgi:glyceraldehyde 3-phosphate dehydrogenase